MYISTVTERTMTLQRLVDELLSVVDWFHFGLCLGIPDFVLTKIGNDYQNADRCKTEVLMEWMNIQEGSWSHIVQALVGIRMKTPAMQIAEKYGRLFVFCLTMDYSTHLLFKGVPAPSLKSSNVADSVLTEVQDFSWSYVYLSLIQYKGIRGQ